MEHDFMFDSIYDSIRFMILCLIRFLRHNLWSGELGQQAQVRAFSPFEFAV